MYILSRQFTVWLNFKWIFLISKRNTMLLNLYGLEILNLPMEHYSDLKIQNKMKKSRFFYFLVQLLFIFIFYSMNLLICILFVYSSLVSTCTMLFDPAAGSVEGVEGALLTHHCCVLIAVFVFKEISFH